MYVDTAPGKWSSLFCDSIKAWQEALTDAFPNGSPVPIGDLTIPIASFKPKTLEDLVALGNSLEEGISDFVRPQQMPMGIVMSYNHLELSPTGEVVSEILIRRKMVERLKRKIQGMEVEDILPIDFRPHTLKIFQGCTKGQGLKQGVKGLEDIIPGSEHPFLVSAPSATLRLDHPGSSRTVQARRVARTFSLRSY